MDICCQRYSLLIFHLFTLTLQYLCTINSMILKWYSLRAFACTIFYVFWLHFNFIMTNIQNVITTGFLYLQCKNLAIFAEMIFPETCLTTTSAIFCHFFGFHNIFIFSYGIFGAKCNYR